MVNSEFPPESGEPAADRALERKSAAAGAAALPSTDESRRPASGGAWGVLALFLALGALGAAAWLWWQLSVTRETTAAQHQSDWAAEERRTGDIAHRLEALEAKSAQLDGEDHAQRLTELQGRIGLVETELTARKEFAAESAAMTRSLTAAAEDMNTRMGAAESRLLSLSARTADTRVELDIAEIDYLLRLAQERALLFSDAQTADRALGLASRQIEALGNPLYLGLRADIAAIRQQLAELETVDFSRLSRQLDAAQATIPGLPFRGSAAPPAEAAAGPENEGWWARVKAALSQLVTVRRDDAAASGVPVLADQELLRQRAWLELEFARLAAMRRDNAAYSAALVRFEETVQRWFNPADDRTRAILALKAELAEVELDPQLPDLSGLLAALRDIQPGAAAAGSEPPPTRPENDGSATAADADPLSPESGSE